MPFETDCCIGIFGAQLSWNIFDWGNRRAVVGQRRAQRTQALENRKRIEQRIAMDVGKAHRKMEQTRMLVDVAREALALRRENMRPSADRLKAGITTDAAHAESVTAFRKAETDVLQADLGYRLARAELERIMGSSGDFY